MNLIAKNLTAGDLPLVQLSVPDCKIPASGQVTLTDYNGQAAIREDAQLLGYIQDDKVILNFEGTDLSKAQCTCICCDGWLVPNLHNYAGNPNGHVEATTGDMCVDTNNGLRYWNKDSSNTGWVL